MIPFSSNQNKTIKIVKYMLVGKDKKRSDTSEEQAGDVKILKISPAKMKPDANKMNFLDIVVLIRSIQRAENQMDCFKKGIIDCDQVDCKWRTFCLEGYPVLGKDKT